MGNTTIYTVAEAAASGFFILKNGKIARITEELGSISAMEKNREMNCLTQQQIIYRIKEIKRNKQKL